MIDSMFMYHQNASKDFSESSISNFRKNELESPIIAKILDNFKGFPTLFIFSIIWRGDKKTLVGNLDRHKGFWFVIFAPS